MEQNMNTVTLQSPTVGSNKQANGSGLKIAVSIAAVIAACGIGFGVYGVLDSQQKSQQITNLETEIVSKNQKITELETEISQIGSKDEEASESIIDESETETATENNTVVMTIESTLDENETRTVFKIGECSADGPSVKCPVDVNGKDALISYNSTDGLLRLTLPKE